MGHPSPVGVPKQRPDISLKTPCPVNLLLRVSAPCILCKSLHWPVPKVDPFGVRLCDSSLRWARIQALRSNTGYSGWTPHPDPASQKHHLYLLRTHHFTKHRLCSPEYWRDSVLHLQSGTREWMTSPVLRFGAGRPDSLKDLS